MKEPIRLDSLSTISDNRLIRQIESLRGRERKILAGVLRHLVEIERRRLYLPRGYSSLFEFCTQHLKYSRSAAGRRIAAARALARFSSLEGYILNGEVNLYALSLVSGILTEDNFARVISGIRNRSTHDVEALVARYRPGRILRDRVRTVCVMEPEPGAGNADRAAAARKSTDPGTGGPSRPRNAAGSPDAGGAGSTPGAGSGKSPDSAVVVSGSNTLERVKISRKYKLEFAVDPEFMKKFERTKILLSNRCPGGIGFEELFMLLMDEYIDRHSPEGRTARREKREARKSHQDRSAHHGHESHDDRDPIKETGSGGARPASNGEGEIRSRNIPLRVRDEVFLRDDGKCTYIGSDGRKCQSRWNLQIDHIVPFARGGDNSPGNLRLLCGKHNRLEAERVYGSLHLERFRKKE